MLQGKALTANVKQVHTEYMAAAGKLQKVTYDVTDTEQPMFQQDFAEYKAVVAELEHRLGSIIFQVRPHSFKILAASSLSPIASNVERKSAIL